MKSYSIYDFEVSEAIFNYVSYPDVYDRFAQAKTSQDLSMAEFVFKYDLLLFDDFCRNNYSFRISEVKSLRF